MALVASVKSLLDSSLTLARLTPDLLPLPNLPNPSSLPSGKGKVSVNNYFMEVEGHYLIGFAPLPPHGQKKV